MSHVLGAEESRSGWRLEIWMEDVPAQICAIKLEGAETDEEQEEPAIVALAKTIVDPWTVVVEFCNAEGAVLAAGWLGDVASAT
jgi:hypothetical protein